MENVSEAAPSLKESWAIVVNKVQMIIIPMPMKFDFVIQSL